MWTSSPLWLVGNSSVLSSLAVQWTELSIGISHLFFKIRLHVYQSQLHVLKLRGNRGFWKQHWIYTPRTILWSKNIKQFFTLSGLLIQTSNNLILILVFSNTIYMYYNIFFRDWGYWSSYTVLQQNLPLHFTSKFHFCKYHIITFF